MRELTAEEKYKKAARKLRLQWTTYFVVLLITVVVYKIWTTYPWCTNKC